MTAHTLYRPPRSQQTTKRPHSSCGAEWGERSLTEETRRDAFIPENHRKAASGQGQGGLY